MNPAGTIQFPGQVCIYHVEAGQKLQYMARSTNCNTDCINVIPQV